MKVLDLHCTSGHVFEGWFGSEDDYRSQRERGLLTCPVCGDREVAKKFSVPRINLGASPPAEAPQPVARGGQEGMAPPPPAGATAAARGDDAEMHRRLQAAWLQAARRAAEQAEDVGERFAAEARRIHHGDAPDRVIRGQASAAEAVALIEEGVPVLPLPGIVKKPMH